MDPKSPSWPEDRERLSIIAVRPMASLPTSRWTVFDDQNNTVTPNQTMNVDLLGGLGDKREYRINTGRDGLKRYTIGAKVWTENSQYMRVRVEWKNNHMPAHKEIKIYRDGRAVHVNPDGTDGESVEVLEDTSIMD